MITDRWRYEAVGRHEVTESAAFEDSLTQLTVGHGHGVVRGKVQL